MTEPTWLALLMERLSKQDAVLGEILREAKRTNGRVTALEQRAAVNDAVDAMAEKTATRERRRREFMVGSIAVVVAGAIAPIGHFLGLW